MVSWLASPSYTVTFKAERLSSGVAVGVSFAWCSLRHAPGPRFQRPGEARLVGWIVDGLTWFVDTVKKCGGCHEEKEGKLGKLWGKYLCLLQFSPGCLTSGSGANRG